MVGEAANGEEGLEVIRRYRPDLIVTDIRMPKLDGIEMLRRLREDGEPGPRGLSHRVQRLFLRPVGR